MQIIGVQHPNGASYFASWAELSTSSRIARARLRLSPLSAAPRPPPPVASAPAYRTSRLRRARLHLLPMEGSTPVDSRPGSAPGGALLPRSISGEGRPPRLTVPTPARKSCQPFVVPPPGRPRLVAPECPASDFHRN
jgi:hypothetical protein